eukprot:2894959-Amphidinium_carterae.1
MDATGNNTFLASSADSSNHCAAFSGRSLGIARPRGHHMKQERPPCSSRHPDNHGRWCGGFLLVLGDCSLFTLAHLLSPSPFSFHVRPHALLLLHLRGFPSLIELPFCNYATPPDRSPEESLT